MSPPNQFFDEGEENRIVEKIVGKIEDKIQQPGASLVQWLWRLAILVLCAVARPDWVSGFLTGIGWTFWQRVPLIIVLANVQVSYYFCFFHWLSKEVKNAALIQTVRLLEESRISRIIKDFFRIFKNLKMNGTWLDIRDLIDQIKQLSPRLKGWFLHKANHVTNPENRPIKFIKAAGYPGLFFASCSPGPGWRSMPAAFCGSLNWRAGLYALMAGNVINVTYSQLIWSFLKSTFGDYFWPAFAVFYIISIFFTIGMSRFIHLFKGFRQT